ncbi:MAG: phosphomannomutase [Thermodesulfovibrionia bacterium]
MGEMIIRIKDLMDKSNVRFGTSGARGLVKDMTDEVCYAYTIGFIRYLEETGELKGRKRIAIGGDLRDSTERIMDAITKAVLDTGYIPKNCGRIPSPAIANYGFMNRIPCIMVTGSHIPDDRNGIKFTKGDGEILKDDEEGIKRQVVTIPSGIFNSDGMLSVDVHIPKQDNDAIDLYISRYIDAFPDSPLKGFRIGVYQHSAVGRDIVVKILESLGADVTPLGRSDAFIPVDTEAIRDDDIGLALRWSEEYGLDSIVSTDGDGDRPMISDENGKWLRGDIAGILCASYLNADAVVTPVSSNTAVERCGIFKRVYRTKIGSPYVIEGMKTAIKDGMERVVGYEANGGFLTASPIIIGDRILNPLPTRDGIIPIISILTMAREKGKGISGLINELPQRFTASDRLRDFPTEKGIARLRELETGGIGLLNTVFGEYFGMVSSIDVTDGLRIYFESGEIIHLRPSGNAPEFRCYVEADSEERADEMRGICIGIMKGWR